VNYVACGRKFISLLVFFSFVFCFLFGFIESSFGKVFDIGVITWHVSDDLLYSAEYRGVCNILSCWLATWRQYIKKENADYPNLQHQRTDQWIYSNCQ
jgi:hypothetical protein